MKPLCSFLSIAMAVLSVMSTACQTSHRLLLKNIDTTITTSPVFEKNFTGFELYDPDQQKVIYAHNAGKYFNPASNTKLFTFYAALNILGDSIPALKYEFREDSLIFRGTGDPSFLNADLYPNCNVFDFLKNTDANLYYTPQVKHANRYGPGWAWDDFNDYYATEKSEFPIYGNVARFYFNQKGAPPYIIPYYFSQSLVPDSNYSSSSVVHRREHENIFHYTMPTNDIRQEPKIVPFRHSSELLVSLLADTLGRPVQLISEAIPLKTPQIIYSLPADSLYKRMLQASDNFIAEHLLMLCAGVVADTLESRIAISYVKEHYLNDLQDELRWIDGSGLSRYNLFTPRSIVKLLEKIRHLVPEERLYELLPEGGVSGTLIDYPIIDQPYIYAKTGALSNNYALSGYLITKSGKTLIFSFMNNNYVINDGMIKNEMRKVLENIYELY